MDAGTRLIAVLALIWALAAAGGADRERTRRISATPVDSVTAMGINLGNHNETLVRDAGSLGRSAGWRDGLRGVGMNHNETLVRDSASLARSAGWRNWLRGVLASVFARVAT